MFPTEVKGLRQENNVPPYSWCDGWPRAGLDNASSEKPGII